MPLDYLSPQTPPPPPIGPRIVNGLAALVLRLGTGIPLIAVHLWHELVLGWNHVWHKGPWPLVDQMASMGVPFAEFLTPALTVVSTVTLGLLVLGILSRACAAILLAFALYTLGHALRIEGGWLFAEAVTTYATAFAALVVLGSGFLSLDAVLSRKKPAPKKKPLA